MAGQLAAHAGSAQLPELFRDRHTENSLHRREFHDGAAVVRYLLGRTRELSPADLPVAGAILAEQVKFLDWRVRQAEWVCRLPSDVTDEVLDKLGTLLT